MGVASDYYPETPYPSTRYAIRSVSMDCNYHRRNVRRPGHWLLTPRPTPGYARHDGASTPRRPLTRLPR